MLRILAQAKPHLRPPHGASCLFKTEEDRCSAFLQASFWVRACVSLQQPSSRPPFPPDSWRAQSAERFGTGGMSRTFFPPVQGVTENADAQNRRVHLWWQSIQLFALGLRPPAAGRVGGKEQLLLQPNLNQEFQYNNTGFQSYQLLVRAGLSSERANQSFCDD